MRKEEEEEEEGGRETKEGTWKEEKIDERIKEYQKK